MFQRAVLVLCAYYLAARLGLLIPYVGTHVSLVWLPTGVAIAALWQWGPRMALAILLAATAANAGLGGPLWLAAAIGAGNTLGPWLSVALLRSCKFDSQLARRQDLLAYLTATAAGMLLSSTNGTLWLSMAGVVDAEHFGGAWLSWWLGDAVGALLGGIPLLAVTRDTMARAFLGRHGLVNTALQAVVLLCGCAVFSNWLGPGSALLFPLLALPFVLIPLLAMQGGVLASSTAVLLLSATAAYGTAKGHGPFVGSDAHSGTLALWSYITAQACTSLLICGSATELQASRRQFFALIGHAQDGILVLDSRDAMVLVNAAAFEMLQLQGQSCLGQPLRLIPHGNGALLADLLAEQTSPALKELVLHRADGRELHVEYQVARYRDASGHWQKHLILRDITERKEAERRVGSSEALLKGITDNLQALISYVDTSQTYRFANAYFRDAMGTDPADLVGQTMQQFLGSAAHAQLRPHIEGALRGERQRFERTGWARNADIHFLVDYVPDVKDDGRVAGFFIMVLDITKRRHAEIALARSEQTLRSIMDHLPAIVSAFDTEHRCTFANAQFRTYYGREPESLLGGTQRELRGEAVYAQIGPHLQAALRGEPRQFEVDAVIGGRQYWLQQSLIPQVDPDGAVHGYYSVSFDITERKHQAEALRKSEMFLARTGQIAGVGGWEFDLNTQKIYWSEETRRIHGVDPDYEPTLDAALSFYTSTSRTILEAAVQRGMEHGEPWDLELQFTRATGELIWVRAVGAVEFSDTGVPQRMLGAFQDVSDRVGQRIALQEANERTAVATDSGGIGIWQLDLDAKQMVWDGWMHRLFGTLSSDAADPFDLWRKGVHPEDWRKIESSLTEAVIGGQPFEAEFRVIWSDGSVRHLRTGARLAQSSVGQPRKVIGSCWDVTELRRLADQLSAEHALLSVTLQSIGDAVITTDAHCRVTWMNPVAERLTGWLAAEAKGRPLLQVFHVVHQDTREAAADPVQACLSQDRIVGLAHHSLLISRNGPEYGIEDSAAPIRSAVGEVLGAVLVFHDVSEQRRLSGEMTYRATHDALTGLVNRAEFESRMRRVLDKVHDDDAQHALLYIDLDQFKLVNDACGHAVGDQLLQQMGKLFGDAVRSRDTLARLGGDEFAIFLEHCSVDQAQRVAQKICDQMEVFRFIHEDRRFRIGTSIGLVPVDKRWSSLAAVQQAADASCYAAKEAGRNRVHVWFDTDAARQERHMEMQWTSRLEQALDDDNFVLYAQRIQPLKATANGIHAEVLLRLRQADGSLVLPGSFLPAAERFHLASRIDRWVLRHAVDWMRALKAPAAVELLSVNLSGQSVGDRSFHRWALDLLAHAGPQICAQLCIEITETAAVTNMADAVVFIEHLRTAGVKVSLDDFGSGASSFGYLKNLAVDFLKIDGQFVRDLIDDPLDEAAVRCFADVARVVGVKTIAEFVDKPAVLERLRAIGIDFAQGFLLHRPELLSNLTSSNLQVDSVVDELHDALRER